MQPLEVRQLGGTDLYPTALALGCAWIGSHDDSDREAAEVVRFMLDQGVNLLDVDASYQHGQGEVRLGHALRGIARDRYYLSTKLGTHPERAGDYSAEAARWSVEQSLKNLGVEHLDLLLIHDPPEIETPLAPGGALEEMVKLKEAGLTRYIGIGCREHAFLQRAMQTGLMDAIITFKDYTLLNQSAAASVIPMAREKGVGVLLGSPLDMGQLAGAEPDPRRSPRAHAMWDWCRQRGFNVRDLAIQFALALSIDGAVLAGPATVEEAEQLIASAAAPIPDQIWQAFAATFHVPQPATR